MNLASLFGLFLVSFAVHALPMISNYGHAPPPLPPPRRANSLHIDVPVAPPLTPCHSSKSIMLSDLTVIKNLESGAFGQIKEVRHACDGRHYAMKVFTERSPLPGSLQQEMAVLRHFSDSEFLMNFVATFLRNTKEYAVMPLMDGDIFSLVQSSDLMSLRDIRTIISQVMHGVQEMHHKGFVHQDIKMENILYTMDVSTGMIKVKLTDFGVAHSVVDVDTGITRKSGSHGLSAPETLNGQQNCYMSNLSPTEMVKIKLKADIWSIGVVAFEMITKTRLPESELDILRIAGELPARPYYPEQFFALPTLDDKLAAVYRLMPHEDGRMMELLLDFIRLCLKINPSARLSVDEALAHTFFTLK